MARNKFKYEQLSKKFGKGFRFSSEDGLCTEAYLRSSKMYNRITNDEEQSIIARIKNGDKDSKKLRETLIMSHQPFIILFAQRHCPLNSDLFMDLIQEGNYGMCVALERFDPSKNVKFMTYANSWIAKYMFEFLQNNDLVQRNNRSKTWNKDTKVREEFVAKYGCEPTCDEMLLIFEEMGIKLKNPADLGELEIIPIDQNPANASSAADDDDDTVAPQYGETDDIVGRIDTQMKADLLRVVMDRKLTAEECMAVAMKFGFDGMEEFTTKEIAEFMETTTYNINLLVKSAIEKMKAECSDLMETA